MAGWQIWDFLIEVCVCVRPYSVASVVSLGVKRGVRQMKEALNEWRQPVWRMWFIKDTSYMNRA